MRLTREVDATADIGEPLATAVFARLLGITDTAPFAALARRVAVNLDPLAGSAAAIAGRAAMGELTRYLDAHTAHLHADVPLARLAADGRLERREMLGVVSLAIVGGWQPLAEMVANALYWLLPRPDAVAQIREGDATLARTAVDELVRLEAPIPFTARVTTSAVDLAGTTIPSGSRVLAVIAAANRDPAVFAGADDLRIDRSPNPHLAFGAGSHFCLGASLVREAGALVLQGILRSFPDIRGPEHTTWAPSLVPRRLTAFPIGLTEALRHAG